jgi:hypothetical protein
MLTFSKDKGPKDQKKRKSKNETKSGNENTNKTIATTSDENKKKSKRAKKVVSSTNDDQKPERSKILEEYWGRLKRPTKFEKELEEAGMFIEVKDDWHAGANDREQKFRRSLSAWVDAHKHDAGNRAIAERLSKHVRYVTDAEFRTAFQDAVMWAIDALTRHAVDQKVQFDFVAIAYKSSAWLNRVAWNIMSRYHNDNKNKYEETKNKSGGGPKLEMSGYIDVDERTCSVLYVYEKSSKDPPVDEENQHVVLCDDAAYSGNQLYRILEALLRNKHDENRRNNTSIWRKTTQHMHVYVVVPFFSEAAYERVESLVTHEDVKTHEILPYKIAMELKHGHLFTVHIKPVSKQNVMKPSILGVSNAMGAGLFEDDLKDEYYSETTLTTFDHKTPDDVSFFPMIHGGQLIRGGKFSNPEKNADDGTWVPFLNHLRRAY